MCAIGRALMGSPRLVLIDEVSLGLAPILVTRVFAAVETLVRDGVAIVLVEQNARLGLRTVDRACVLEAGRIAREGSSADLLADLGVQDADLGGFEA